MTEAIVRVFVGIARAGFEQAYGDYLSEVACPHLLARSGLQGLEVGASDDNREYVVLSMWDGSESLAGFTGGHAPSLPHLSAEEERMLEHASVRHFRRLARFEHLDSSPGLSMYPVPDPRVRVDPDRKRVWIDGRRVDLPPLEFRLLERLIAAPGKVLTPATLSQTLWPGSTRAQANDVRRMVYRLRQALGPVLGSSLIRTRPGFGYFLDV